MKNAWVHVRFFTALIVGVPLILLSLIVAIWSETHRGVIPNLIHKFLDKLYD